VARKILAIRESVAHTKGDFRVIGCAPDNMAKERQRKLYVAALDGRSAPVENNS
jgi:hypothetical protein